MEYERKAIFFNILGGLATLVIIITGPLLLTDNLTFILIQVFGLLLIIWALISRSVSKNKHHKLPSGYFFVTQGPYEIIRHPIYAGYLLIISSLIQYNFVFLRIFAFILLIVVILLKIIREEYTMNQKIEEYKAYQSKTKRLIPYLF